MQVAMSLYNVHRHPKIWKEPNSFIPERFDGESEFYKTPDEKARSPTSHCPFTLGIRSCPGQSLALLNLKLLLVYFFKKFDYDISLDEKAAEYERQHGLVSFAQGAINTLYLKIKTIKH